MSSRFDVRAILARTAMALVFVTAAMTLGGCGGGMPPEQREAMSRIQSLGGHVDYREGGYQVDLTGTEVEDRDLAQLKNIPKLKNVGLKGTRITDEGLKALEGISTLEIVWLERSAATKQGVDNLRKALPKADVRF